MSTTLILAGCVISNAKGEVLLMHRNTPERTHWELPGGKVEQGETPESAAIREMKEELGIDVQITRLLASRDFTQEGRHMLYHWYEAEIVSGTPKLQEDKFDDLAWFGIEKMQEQEQELSLNALNLLRFLEAGIQS